jgi:transposase
MPPQLQGAYHEPARRQRLLLCSRRRSAPWLRRQQCRGHREFLRFLKLIDQKTPAGLALHLIVDNYATHKTPAVKRWLKANPRIHLHFTPTSASWLNMVERFFAEITRNRIRRGAFKSVAELKQAIMQYLEKHNAAPRPFVWTKSVSQILQKVDRAKQALE